MGASSTTPNVGLPQFADTDRPSWRGDINGAFADIDEELASRATTVDLTTLTESVATKADQVTVNGKVSKGELVVNVTDYGATGDGATDDTAALAAAIAAGSGRIVYVPSGTYMVDAVTSLTISQPKTRLMLDPGATLKVIPNNADNYGLITVTAADVTIEGGTLIGDVGFHTGTTGEWGHLIIANPGSDRLRIRGVRLTKAWGDGIILQGGASDQAIIDCVADDNRRQGMSITKAIRPRVIGGSYINTGLTANTAPSAGIDVEPNAGNQVVDCVIDGVVFSGNKGAGLLVSAAAGASVTLSVGNCRSTGSTGADGVYIYGPNADTIKATLSNVVSESNAGGGFTIDCNNTRLIGCVARKNTIGGFLISQSDCRVLECVAEENGRNGITINAGAARTRIIGGTTRANGQTTTNTYINLDNFGTFTTIIGHMCDAGALANAPKWGYVIRTGSSARLLSCDISGVYGTLAVFDQVGGTPMFPIPGAVKQTFPVAATDAASTQALANSLRTALINLGYGA
jgi:hypothetical protein